MPERARGVPSNLCRPKVFLSRPKSEAHPVRARKTVQALTSKLWAARSFCMGLHHSPFKQTQRALGVPMILGLLRDRDGRRTSARAVFGTQLIPSW